MATRRNPFDYGGPVSGSQFAGRRNEVAAVVSRLSDHIGVVVTAPRRYGKSSLVLQACEELGRRQPKPAVVSVNLLRAGNLAAASGLLLRGLYHVPGGPWHRLRQVLPGFLRRIRVQPTTTFDQNGHPTFSFAPGLAPADLSTVVDDVYGVLDEVGRERPAVLFLDEFQAVTDLDAHLPRHLKALADEHRRVSLVLAGSKEHLMEGLVLSRGAPLYNMLERFSLGPIPEEDWVPFLVRRARSAQRPFADHAVARALWQLANPVPFDVQRLAYESFNQAADRIVEACLRRATEEIVRHEAVDFARTFEKLSAGQRRVLKALAVGLTATPGSAEFARAVGLADSTSVRKATKTLIEAEILVDRKDGLAVDDPFFAAWLRGADGTI